MKTEVRCNVIPDPVFAAAHLAKRKRSVDRIGNYREGLHIQPQWIVAVFQAKLSSVCREVPVHKTQGRVEPALGGVILQCLLQFSNLGAKALYRLRKVAVGGRRFNVLQIVRNTTGDAGLFCKGLLLNP
ncbi:hypothetical protein JCM18382A_06470 [Bradyrhizobium sp. 17-4]